MLPPALIPGVRSIGWHRAPAWTGALLVLLAAALLRLWHIDRAGIAHWDAGTYTSARFRIGPYADEGFLIAHTPPLMADVFARLFAWFGEGDRIAAAAMALAGVLTVALVLLAGLHWFGRTVALVAAAALAGMEFHVHFSRQALADVPFTLLFLAAVLAASAAIERRSQALFAVAGLATAAAQLTKYHGFFALGVVGLVLAWMLARGEIPRGERSRMLAGFTLACALAGGACAWLWILIDATVGVEQMRAIRARWMAPPGLYLIPKTLLFVRDCLLAWVSPWVLVPAAGGFAVMLARRSRADRLVLVWTAVFLASLPFYTTYPRLLLPVLVPLCLAAGVGVEQALAWMTRRAGRRARALPAACAAGMLGAGALASLDVLRIDSHGYREAAAVLREAGPSPLPDILVTQHALLFYLHGSPQPFLNYELEPAAEALREGRFRFLVADLRLIHAPEYRRYLEENAERLELVARVPNPLPETAVVNTTGFATLRAMRAGRADPALPEILGTIRVWRLRPRPD